MKHDELFVPQGRLKSPVFCSRPNSCSPLPREAFTCRAALPPHPDPPAYTNGEEHFFFESGVMTLMRMSHVSGLHVWFLFHGE